MAKKDKSKKEKAPSVPVLKPGSSLQGICDVLNNSPYLKGSGGSVSVASSMAGVERLSTGSLRLDSALDGGYVRGRIYEIFGPEAGGKTTLCLEFIKAFQDANPDKAAAVVDSEHALDPAYAQKIGIDMDRLLIHRPAGGEEALNVIKALVVNDVECIVLDSVASLTTSGEREGNLGDSKVGEQARLMSSSLRQLVSLISMHNCTVLFTNQIREKVGVMYGNPETTPGGHGLRFYASARIRVSPSAQVKETVGGEEVVVANVVSVRVVKSKISPPHRNVQFHITYGIGIDSAYEILAIGLDSGVISKRGSWYSVGTDNIGQGTLSVLRAIREDKVLAERIRTESGGAVAPDFVEVHEEEGMENGEV